MIDSLTTHQIALVQKLGRWRDEGHRLAVGFGGEVFIHTADKGEHHVATEEREGAARRQGPSGRQRAAGQSGAATPPQSARQDGGADLRGRYLASVAEVREYYPDLRVIEVEDGIWVVTQIFPIGRDGPSYAVCLFLSDNKAFDPKAFAFVGDGRRAVPLGTRHTNYPDSSICAFCADDGVWRPGESPLVLLNLYAEWLVCQLFFAIEKRWPGRQYGLSATYRLEEFQDDEWCDCGRRSTYSTCHKPLDQEEVRRLKMDGHYVPLPSRQIPQVVTAFARSAWKKAPKGIMLPLHEFVDQAAARDVVLQRVLGLRPRNLDSRTALLTTARTIR